MIDAQRALLESPARFRVVCAGRRTWKTQLAQRYWLDRALECDASWPDPRFFFAAPTLEQAKRVHWDWLKANVPEDALVRPPLESSLTIRLKNGAKIVVVSPAKIEGLAWDGGVLDYFAYMDDSVWPEIVKPAVHDRQGGVWFVSVPNGFNLFHTLCYYAVYGRDPDWAVFPPDEIKRAKRTLDRHTYSQEYDAKFLKSKPGKRAPRAQHP